MEWTEDKIELLKSAYNILKNRDPEFKKEWEELNKHSLENIKNSEELRQKAISFSLKYDKILADEIRKMI